MLEKLSTEVSPWIFALLIKYKYLVLFPVLVVEGPIATILVGALATPEVNLFSIVPLFFFVIFADVAGDTFYYLIGKFAGTRVLDWIGKKKNINYHKKFTNYFEKYGGRTLMIGKVSHGLGWPVMVFAGSAEMSYLRFITFCLATSIIKSFILLGIGYLYSDNYQEMISFFGSASVLISLTAFVICSIYLIGYLKRNK